MSSKTSENREEGLKGTRLAAAYIGERIKVILMFCLFTAIFQTVFYLYNLPADAVSYASLLFFSAAGLCLAADSIQFYRKHKALRHCRAGITVSLDELPEPSGTIEQEYQELLRRLFADRAELISAEDSRSTEMMDYYTLWAHQIKTPIAAMDLILQRGEAGEARAELAQELFKIGQYADMVLQYLRLDSMAEDLLLKEYGLTDMVKQAVKKHAPSFIYKKISLELKETDTKVLTDEKWLVFVLEQLLSNALKYTPERGKISIYEESGKSGERKRLVIEDTGIGIGKEDLPRIFERGFTGKNGRLDKKSTGIGLYLCREVLERLSHRIEITSEPDRGTRVCLDLTADKLQVE